MTVGILNNIKSFFSKEQPNSAQSVTQDTTLQSVYDHYPLDITSVNTLTFDEYCTPMDTFQISQNYKVIFDEWKNNVASINCHNSVMQYSQFSGTRLSYYECAQLSRDAIINKAIHTFSKDIVGNKGLFNLETPVDNADDIITDLESTLDELKFWDIIKKASETAFTFGGAFIYLDTNQKGAVPFNFNSYKSEGNQLTRLVVISPMHCSPYKVNTSDILNEYYMKPQEWYIQGSGIVHTDNLCSLCFFEVPDIEKPLFNYLGVGLPQFMKTYVRNAEIIRESVCDILLRHRIMVFKSNRPSIQPIEVKKKIEGICRFINNSAALLLEKDDEFLEHNTNLGGIESLVAQAQQHLAIPSRIPNVKLLGLSPQGLNNTGEHDMKTYYDEAESLQKAVILPIIEKIAQIVLWNKGIDNRVKFTFTPLAQESNMERAQRAQTVITSCSKMLEDGIITEEQYFNILQREEILLNKGDTYEGNEEEDSIYQPITPLAEEVNNDSPESTD